MAWSHGVKVLTVLSILANTNSESTEDQNFPYSSFFEPPTSWNLHDVFSNKLGLSPTVDDSIVNRFALAAHADESYPTKITHFTNDDSYSDKIVHKTIAEEEVQSTTPETTPIHVQSHFVEFDSLATSEAEPTTIPPPKFLLNSSFITTTTTPKPVMTTTTEDPDQTFVVTVKVQVKKAYQRGVLDLLFPPKRVKSFKTMFDSLRHALSHTFR